MPKFPWRGLLPVLIPVVLSVAACVGTVGDGESSPTVAPTPAASSPTPTSTTTPPASSPTPPENRGTGTEGVEYRGVNLAGAEFRFDSLPGELGVDYTYPGPDDVTFFTDRGMNTMRLPFLWERLQPRLGGDLDPDELARLEGFVATARDRGATVVLDPHNYARYHGEVIGSAEVPTSTFADLWARLATRFADDPGVVFGLMNEPHDIDAGTWLVQANAAVAAIRGTGAANLILVPGTQYTGADSWSADWYGTPNAAVMDGVVDPLDNYAIEVHQYLDGDSSGTSPVCEGPTIGSERLADFTAWLRLHHQRAFLGEFGGGDDGVCLAAIDDMLTHLDTNADVWIGWTYWAAGPWWGEGPLEIQPSPDGTADPQLEVLERHLPR